MALPSGKGAVTVLILGSGGREHVLAWKLSQSPRAKEVLVAVLWWNIRTQQLSNMFVSKIILEYKGVVFLLIIIQMLN